MSSAQAARQTMRDDHGRYAPGSTASAESSLAMPEEKTLALAADDAQQAHQLGQHTLVAASRFGVVTDEDLANHDRQHASVLLRTDDGHVLVKTGTIEHADGQPWLVTREAAAASDARRIPLDRRGSWDSGEPVKHAAHQLAVPGGQETADWMADNFVQSMHATKVGPPTIDDLPVDDGENLPPSTVAAIYQYDHPGFAGAGGAAGCLFFATDITPNSDRGAEDPLAGDPIVNGYLWVPGDSQLTSESGSIHHSDMGRFGAVRLDVNTEHLSVDNMWRDLPPDRQGVMAFIETSESGARPAPLSCSRCRQARFATTNDLDARARWCFGDATNGVNL